MPAPVLSRSLVVLPTYNERDNIEPIVRAVLSQSLDFEVLVVDDHSPDGTGVIADRLDEELPRRVHVMHRAGKRGLVPPTSRVSNGRSPANTRTCSKWTPTFRTIRPTCCDCARR